MTTKGWLTALPLVFMLNATRGAEPVTPPPDLSIDKQTIAHALEELPQPVAHTIRLQEIKDAGLDMTRFKLAGPLQLKPSFQEKALKWAQDTLDTDRLDYNKDHKALVYDLVRFDSGLKFQIGHAWDANGKEIMPQSQSLRAPNMERGIKSPGEDNTPRAFVAQFTLRF